MNKKAFAHEQKEKKTMSYFYKINELIARVAKDPFGTDYSAELEKLHKANPKDKALILQAERECYEAAK